MTTPERRPFALDDPRMRAWIGFLQAHATVTRRLEAELQSERELSLAEYDALVQLALADDRRLRMSELADRLVLSRSGVTRLVDRLEGAGYVARAVCPSDARGAFASLTDAGLARLRDATPVHLRGVRQHFLDVVPADELEALTRTMERLTGASTDDRPPVGATDLAGAPSAR